MTAPATAADVVAGADSADFRLQRLEVSGWGPFQSGVSILDLDSQTSLVTGDPGAASYALVEAILTLLVPAEHASTYLGDGCSVVVGVFTTSGGARTVTLAQVFQRVAAAAEPARLYVCAERDLSITAHFGAPDGSLELLAESLSRLGAQVEHASRRYVAWFRRRFGIRDAGALRSFRALASMRSTIDLDEIVRRHLLDPFDPAPRVGRLLAAFGALEHAQSTLQDLRRGEALLTEILARCQGHDSQSQAVAKLRACREGLHDHFARNRLALLDKRLVCMDGIREQLSVQLARLEGRLEERRRQADEIRAAVATNGGERLERLSTEIRRMVGLRDARRARAERYADLLRRVGEEAPADEVAFHAQRGRLKAMHDSARDRDAYLERAMPGYGARLADVQRELDTLPVEIGTLKPLPTDAGGEVRGDPTGRLVPEASGSVVAPGDATSAARIAALEARVHQLEVRVAAITNLIAREQGQRKLLADRLETLARLEESADFVELDWAAVTAEIAERLEERQHLVSGSDVLKQLSQRLQHVENEIVRTEREADTAKDRRSRIEQRLHDAQALRARSEALLVRSRPELGSIAPSDLAERLESLCAQASSGRELSLETLDGIEDDVRDRVTSMLRAEEETLTALRASITQAMQRFQAQFPSVGAGLEALPEAAPRYEELLVRLRQEDLPRLETDFQALVHVDLSDEFASLDATLAHGRDLILARIEKLNRSLARMRYTPEGHVVLRATLRRDAEVEAFRAELRFCAERTPIGSRHLPCAEAKLGRMRRLIDRARGRADHAAADCEWRTRVFDVRNWLAFSAVECARTDESASVDRVPDSAQGARIAFTVLAGDLVERLGLDTTSRRSLRFAVLGAAFSRNPNEAIRHALSFFRQLGVQVLVVAPFANVAVIEPFVGRVGIVHKASGRAPTLRTVAIHAEG